MCSLVTSPSEWGCELFVLAKYVLLTMKGMSDSIEFEICAEGLSPFRDDDRLNGFDCA